LYHATLGLRVIKKMKKKKLLLPLFPSLALFSCRGFVGRRDKSVRTGSWTGPPRGKRAPRVGISATVSGRHGLRESLAHSCPPPLHTVEHDPFIKSQLAGINLRAVSSDKEAPTSCGFAGGRNPRSPPCGPCRGTSLIRNTHPHRITIGP